MTVTITSSSSASAEYLTSKFGDDRRVKIEPRPEVDTDESLKRWDLLATSGTMRIEEAEYLNLEDYTNMTACARSMADID